MTGRVLPPVGPDWQTWARQVSAHIQRFAARLQWRTTGASAAENGVMLWDEDAGCPVVSDAGAFRQIATVGPHGTFTRSTSLTAATINTAEAVSLDASIGTDGLALGTPASRVAISDSGIYAASLSVQLLSGNASAKAAWLWFAVNGTAVASTARRVSITENAAEMVATMACHMALNAGDYAELMFATTDTGLTISATAATAFSPAVPSVSIAFTKVSA